MKMYRKIILVFGLIVMLGGCGQSRVEPKEAVEAFIQAEMYGKEIDKYNEAFHVEFISEENEFVTGFLEEFNASGEMNEKEANELAVKIQDKFMNETSFKVGDVKEDKEDRLVTVSFIGIDFLNGMDSMEGLIESEMIKDLKEKGYKIESLENLGDVTEEQADELLDLMSDESYINRLSFTAFNSYIDGLKATDTPKEMVIRLTPNKDEKSAWSVVDRENTVDKMADLLLGE